MDIEVSGDQNTIIFHHDPGQKVRKVIYEILIAIWRKIHDCAEYRQGRVQFKKLQLKSSVASYRVKQSALEASSKH